MFYSPHQSPCPGCTRNISSEFWKIIKETSLNRKLSRGWSEMLKHVLSSNEHEHAREHLITQQTRLPSMCSCLMPHGLLSCCVYFILLLCLAQLLLIGCSYESFQMSVKEGAARRCTVWHSAGGAGQCVWEVGGAVRCGTERGGAAQRGAGGAGWRMHDGVGRRAGSAAWLATCGARGTGAR